MTIRDYLEKAVADNPKRTFVYYEDDEISYEAFNLSVNKRANYFLRLGIKKGDNVVLFLPNCPEFLYVWFGLAKIGAVMVPINIGYLEKETEYIVNHSEAAVVVVTSQYLDMILKVKEHCPMVKQILLADGEARSDIPVLSEAAADCGGPVPETVLTNDDAVCILYTSGTTGPPKGCVLPNDYYTLGGRQWGECNAVKPDDRLFTCLPLFHMNAQSMTTMGTLVNQASMILMPRFSSSKFWEQIDKYKATQFQYIGAMLDFIENLPESPKDRQHSVVRIYGGGAGREQLERVEKRYNVKATEAYGSTEDSLVTSNYYINGPRKLGSIGKPVLGRSVRIVDDDDNELPPNQKGEIVCNGKPMMLCYFKEPVATAEAMKGGWFHTGDNGYMDDEGFFYFSERKKDIIRRAGENISAIEVENVIKTHPKILNAAVIGVPDKVRREEVKVYVILESGETEATVPPVEIVTFAKARLAYFKIPRYIEYRDRDFPRTPTNRIQKPELKKEKEDLTSGCIDCVKEGITG